MEKKKVSFVQGAAILGIAGLIVKVIGAAFRIPLANTIGLIGTSYYDTAYPYYSWLLVISSSGLPTAISKMVSERVTLGDYRGAHRVFTTAMQILCCIGLLTSILMFFGSDYIARLHMLTSTQDGFAIAEADLAQRGPGDFLGTRQHGLSAFTAASLAGDVGILQEVQEAAQALLDAPTPESQPLLQLAQARLAALAEEVVGN